MEKSEVKVSDTKLYRIFVAGVPGDASKETLLDYFQTFGSIESIKHQQMSAGRRAYIVKPSSLDTFNAIVDPRVSHTLSGRAILCCPYESGGSLKKLNMSTNERRVIIKRVPSQISTNDLVHWLESNVGAVWRIFPYCTENIKKRISKERKYKTFSVVFKEADSANKAIIIQSVCFIQRASVSTIEMFKNKVKEKPEEIETLKKSHTNKIHTTKEDHKLYTTLTKDIKLDKKECINRDHNNIADRQLKSSYIEEWIKPSARRYHDRIDRRSYFTSPYNTNIQLNVQIPYRRQTHY